MKKNLLYFFLLITFSAAAQDAHFSQYNTTPMSINPAMTGIFDGTLRFSNNYRSQWSALGKPYKTIYSSLDFPLGKQKNKNHYWGAGIMINSDKTGEAQFYTTLVEASLSFTTALNDYGTHFISFGAQTGLDQRGIDLTKVTWDSQWNGNNFDPTLPAGEVIQLQQFTFVDFNMGAMWYYLPDEFNNGSIGISFAHLNRPNTSFYVKQTDKMDIRYTLNASADLAVDRNENTTWISPKLLVMLQGEHSEIDIGGYVKNRLILKSKYTNFTKEMLFSWGACYRWNDAIIASARIEYGRFGLGFSYDLNVSSLANQAGSANSTEISFSYIVPIKRGQVGAVTNRMPKFF
jgi:type IX secretion system PorP/SprF family membrane protein